MAEKYPEKLEAMLHNNAWAGTRESLDAAMSAETEAYEPFQFGMCEVDHSSHGKTKKLYSGSDIGFTADIKEKEHTGYSDEQGIGFRAKLLKKKLEVADIEKRILVGTTKKSKDGKEYLIMCYRIDKPEVPDKETSAYTPNPTIGFNTNLTEKSHPDSAQIGFRPGNYK